jgi:hypothetical protein
VAAAEVAAILAAQPASARDARVKVFGAAAHVAPLAGGDVSFGGVRDSVATSDHVGRDAGIEIWPGDPFGVEVDYLNATQDVEVGGAAIGEVDLYLGPTLSYVNRGNVELDSGGSGRFGVSVRPSHVSMALGLEGSSLRPRSGRKGGADVAESRCPGGGVTEVLAGGGSAGGGGGLAPSRRAARAVREAPRGGPQEAEPVGLAA